MRWGFCIVGGYQAHHAMTDRILTAAALLTVAAIVAMGFDNRQALARCESSGRSQAECRLVVLGR